MMLRLGWRDLLLGFPKIREFRLQATWCGLRIENAGSRKERLKGAAWARSGREGRIGSMEHFNGSTLASSGRAYVDMDRAMRLTGQTGCFSRSIPHGDWYVIGLKTAFNPAVCWCREWCSWIPVWLKVLKGVWTICNVDTLVPRVLT